MDRHPTGGTITEEDGFQREIPESRDDARLRSLKMREDALREKLRRFEEMGFKELPGGLLEIDYEVFLDVIGKDQEMKLAQIIVERAGHG